MADIKKVEEPKAKPAKAKPPLTDSEGLRVVHATTEPAEDEGKSVMGAAREAYEAEVDADAEEARKQAEWEKFLTER